MMTGLHSQSEWFCKKKKNEFVIEQLSSHMQRERGWGANAHTHTHPLKSQSQSHTHSPLLCPALRLVQSHMLSAWMNTFLSTCPPSPLFLCFALPPSSPYSEWTFFFPFLLLPVSTSLCSLPRIQKAFCCVDVVAMCAGVFTCLQPPLRESVCETESRRQVVDVHTVQQNILI